MKKISRPIQFLYSLGYMLNKNKLLTILFFCGFLVSICIATQKHTWFDSYIDPIAGIMTLLVAIGIALIGYQREWLESLPKTLTVHYVYDGKYYLSCYYADLASEGDIRNWAQQIGLQMTNGAFLDFNPFFNLNSPEVITLEPRGRKTKHYEITILLKSANNLRPKNEGNAFDTNVYKRWYVVHGEKHQSDKKFDLKLIAPPKYLQPISYKMAKEQKIIFEGNDIAEDKTKPTDDQI